jgi:hypothetical protein
MGTKKKYVYVVPIIFRIPDFTQTIFFPRRLLKLLTTQYKCSMALNDDRI